MKPIYKCSICGKYIEEPVHCGKKAILLLDDKRRLMLSKLVSGLLRHYPWEIGVSLDKEGWVSIDDLVNGIKIKWKNKHLYQWVTREHIIALAELDPKGRFEVSGDRIRARYGHSVRVRIEYKISYPPKLYHGTSISKLNNILKQGLRPMKRLYVHTTTSKSDALLNARRHGTPVVLEINVECLRRNNIPVYKAGKTVYLVPYVPPECITRVY